MSKLDTVYNFKEGLKRLFFLTSIGKGFWYKVAKLYGWYWRVWKRLRIPRKYSIEQFFEILLKEEINYVVLRWFDIFPNIRVGGDIDILVSDSDLNKLEKLLVRSPIFGGIPCDIYNVSGSPGYNYKYMAYFPPLISSNILNNSVLYENYIRVPSPIDHALSLSYHAIYHKGEDSGIPKDSSSQVDFNLKIEHDYIDSLSTLFEACNCRVDINMESIDLFLNKRGWRPPIDMLSKLGINNTWCASIAKRVLDEYDYIDGLGVLIVRESEDNSRVIGEVVNEVEKSGIKILYNAPLDEHEKNFVTSQFRGGNWGGGKFSRGQGGAPLHFFVILDSDRRMPGKIMKALHPLADNENLITLKNRVRDVIGLNVLHSTDNSKEACYFINLLSLSISGLTNNCQYKSE
jgi:hypothetical protein